MSEVYKRIGYIDWTDDAAALATAVTQSPKLTREQYVWCPSGKVPTDEQMVAAGVQVMGPAFSDGKLLSLAALLAKEGK